MENSSDRRVETRLRYHWPVWFAEDFNELLSQGQMVDVCSTGASFTCPVGGAHTYTGQKVTTRFSIPHFNSDESFDLASYTRIAHVCRVDEINQFVRRIAVQFAEPLPFRPGEQADTEEDAQQKLKSVVI